jgi:tRNA(Ile)-lysidine synthase
MEKLFIRYLKEIVPEPEKVKFLLAVSGGIDSCALAHLFFQNHLSFDIAHCNFHLRGEDSNLDSSLVTALEKIYKVSVFVKEFDTLTLAQNSGKSVEMAARDLRYEWFAEIGHDYDYIVTAHHANDNAETMLLNLTRGTGLKGMSGIPTVNGKIIRPLLSFSSADILDYVKRHKIEYRDDQSNFSQQYHRNKIRHVVIPKLEEINPGFIHTASNNADIFKKQYDFYIKYMNLYKEKLLVNKEEGCYISVNDLIKEKYYSLILYEILSDFNFNPATINLIAENLHSISGKKYFSATHQLIKDRENLIITPVSEDLENDSLIIPDPDTLQVYGFDVEILDYQHDLHFEDNPMILYADADKLTFPLELRRWKEGDYFFPFGMKGKKKLSDYFTDRKIDLNTKHKIPLLCCNDEIVWVVGFRSDDRYRIEKNKTNKYYKIKYYGIFQ